MDHKDAYPEWKKALIEGRRVFYAAFIAAISAGIAGGIDLTNVKAWIVNLSLSAVAAGIAAVWKWFREVYGQGNYNKWIYKI